jgi:hypothetical protein
MIKIRPVAPDTESGKNIPSYIICTQKKTGPIQGVRSTALPKKKLNPASLMYIRYITYIYIYKVFLLRYACIGRNKNEEEGRNRDKIPGSMFIV